MIPSWATTERQRRVHRRGEIARLNGLVQAVLRAAGMRRWPDDSWRLALTVRDGASLAEEHTEACWTLYWMAAGGDGHIAESYAVTLRFNDRHEAIAFGVTGDHAVWTAGAEPATLADVLRALPPRRHHRGAAPSLALV